MYYAERGESLGATSVMQQAHAYLDGGLFPHVIANVCTFVARPVRDVAAVRKKPCGSLDMMCPGKNMWENEGFTMPICLSTVWMRRLAPGTRSFEWMSFSTARTTPSWTLRPIAVLNDTIYGYDR